MTRDDIIKWAREAGAERNPDFPDWSFEDDQLERFAAIVEDAQAKKMHAEGMVTVGHMRQQIAAQRQPLTKERIGQIIAQCRITLVNYCSDEKQTEFARAIEAAHGVQEKNT
jgi:hypothetical protein